MALPHASRQRHSGPTAARCCDAPGSVRTEGKGSLSHRYTQLTNRHTCAYGLSHMHTLRGTYAHRYTLAHKCAHAHRLTHVLTGTHIYARSLVHVCAHRYT